VNAWQIEQERKNADSEFSAAMALHRHDREACIRVCVLAVLQCRVWREALQRPEMELKWRVQWTDSMERPSAELTVCTAQTQHTQSVYPAPAPKNSA